MPRWNLPPAFACKAVPARLHERSPALCAKPPMPPMDLARWYYVDRDLFD